MRVWYKIGVTLEMIKWEHSIFALPFALTAAMVAASGWPCVYQLVWIAVCMVFARSAGMAFNRWADAELDARNHRTRMRAVLHRHEPHCGYRSLWLVLQSLS
jgi:4-hydroxybenzoate polyprenyltransferase